MLKKLESNSTQKSLITNKQKVICIIIAVLLIIFVMLKLIPEPTYKDGFRNLTEISKFASTLDEYLKIENKNLLNPTFSEYHQNTIKKSSNSLYKKILFPFYKLKIIKSPTFSISFFKNILEEETKRRKNLAWHGNFIQKISMSDSTQIIVFGAIQGAFHSLVRNLEKLLKLGLINENLQITNQNIYFIFLGNAINRSPFSIETFSLILQLMKKNPYNVLYLKGANEFPTGWKNLTLSNELEIRARQYSTSTIPLETEVQDFFDTLPLVIYGTNKETTNANKTNYLKFISTIDDEKIKEALKETFYINFIQDESNDKLPIHKILQQTSLSLETKQAEMKAIICDIKKRDFYEQTDGLKLMVPTNGVITWFIMSCPSASYRIGFNFHYDAFTIIKKNSLKRDWLITLYTRDIYSTNEFSSRSYLLHTGEQNNQNL